jgi:hypothetical protein
VKKVTGRISWFGGKNGGMKPGEPWALYDWLFNETGNWMDQPIVKQNYCALRFDYDAIAQAQTLSLAEVKDWIRKAEIVVEFNGKSMPVIPVDWGPHPRTGRVIDVSQFVMGKLGCRTDDTVTVIIPDWLKLTDQLL